MPRQVTDAWAAAYGALLEVPPERAAELRALAAAARRYLQPQDDPADPVSVTLLRLIEGQEAVLGREA